ncbi:MAG: RHS repeat-associated core domain-containing protein [Bacteroidia bacterium]
MYIYVTNESLTDVSFDNLQIQQRTGVVLQMNEYYPFGLLWDGNGNANYSSGNKYLYNSKELQTDMNLNFEDYGARMFDPQIGRWHCTDGKAELYQNITPFAYAANQPTNAIDPDGKVVIFINGMADASNQGNSSYWRHYEKYTSYVRYACGYGGAVDNYKEYAFDKEVMNQLRDNKARYYDGCVGGTSSWLSEPDLIFSGELGSLSSAFRDNAGYETGKAEAAGIIESLQRTGGVITETIKIITHSMGGAFGKGFVKALKEYIKTLPIGLQKQIKITLVADFDPYQGGELTADPDIKTMQFKHTNFLNFFCLGWLANEDEKGLNKDKDITTNTGTSSDHAITTFSIDVGSLSEGTYKWNGSKWVKQ